MAQENGMTRRGLLGAAGAAGVAALGAAALLPSQSRANIGDYPGLKDARDHLNDARSALTKDTGDFGGHRKTAKDLIDQALAEIAAAVKVADGK